MKRYIFRIIILLLCGVDLSSCRTQYIPVESVKTEYRYHDSILKDSIYQRDSVYIAIKDDTIYIYKYKYMYKYKYVNRTDTLNRTDSIQIPYSIEKQLSGWQQFKVDFGGIAMLVIIIVVFIMLGFCYRNFKIR